MFDLISSFPNWLHFCERQVKIFIRACPGHVLNVGKSTKAVGVLGTDGAQQVEN